MNKVSDKSTLSGYSYMCTLVLRIFLEVYTAITYTCFNTMLRALGLALISRHVYRASIVLNRHKYGLLFACLTIDLNTLNINKLYSNSVRKQRT